MPTPHSTDNYAIGKGKLYIADFPGAGSPAYAEMGNCPSFEIEPAIERLPHYSSREGFRVKDKNPVIQTEYTVSFDLDEFAAPNLRKFIMGTQSGNVLHALQDVDKEYVLKFVSDRPTGPNDTWEFWRMTLSPNGALQLIGEEWMVMSMSGEGLADVANHSSSPYWDVTAVTTTTTTTTTT